MHQEQYFATSPSVDARPRALDVELAGRQLHLQTSNGVFSADRLDKGTRVLLDVVPKPVQEGAALDLGCGWGPIALSLAIAAPKVAVWAVDVNERARALCATNARLSGLSNIRVAAPEAVPATVEFSTIWSNPPIRVGKEVLHEMLHRWLPRLAFGGTAWLVVQKNLGADSLMSWLAGMVGDEYGVERVASDRGFRVITVTRHGNDQSAS